MCLLLLSPPSVTSPSFLSLFLPPFSPPSGFLRRIGQPKILFKPVQPGIKGPREVTFYQGLFRDDTTELPSDIQQLRELIPHYHGIEIIQDRAGQMRILVLLEYYVADFAKRCVCVCGWVGVVMSNSLGGSSIVKGVVQWIDM